MAFVIKMWNVSCEQCDGQSRIDYTFNRPCQYTPSELVLRTEAGNQFDLIPELFLWWPLNNNYSQGYVRQIPVRLA